jgi:protein ImuB
VQRIKAAPKTSVLRLTNPMWIGLYTASTQAVEPRRAKDTPTDSSETINSNPAPGIEALAQCALQFTPLVTIENSHLILLDVGASLRLFGGVDTLLQRLHAECAIVADSPIHLATAPNPTAAALLARVAEAGKPVRADTPTKRQTLLAKLPVAQLNAAAPHLDLLQTLGTHTLRDLALLPRSGVTRRFGRALLDELDRALGNAHDLRLAYCPPPVFTARLELPAQVEAAQALLFGARRLLGQLAGWLGATQRGTLAPVFWAEHDDHPPTTIALRMATPSRDPDRIAMLLREHLERIRLPQAAHTLRLACHDATPLGHNTTDLFATAPPVQESLGRLIERMQARLGPSALLRLRCHPDHRPEAAFRLEWIDGLDRQGQPKAIGQIQGRVASPVHSGQRPVGLPRPLWLLQTPIRLTERKARPCWHGPLALVAGPERIESGWWDAALVERDYFVAQNDDHELVWIFRSRTGRDENAWYLHGLFG